MSRTLGTSRMERWSALVMLSASVIACSSRSGSGSSSRDTLDGSASGTGATSGSGGGGGFGAGGDQSSGGLGGSGGHDVCLVCGGAFGAGGGGGAGGSGGAGGAPAGGAAGSGSGGTPAFCSTPTTNWLPAMKTCQADADCKVIPTFSCCGPTTIYGIATTSASQFAQCFQTSPPQGCPLLGCFSEARTEDSQSYQPTNYGDLSGVEARCVDNGAGAKECTSTLRGSCAHDVTRCAAGDVCSNPCGASCTCQNGYVNCPRPTGTCTSTTAVCTYPQAPSGQTITTCSCPSPGAPWSCTP